MKSCARMIFLLLQGSGTIESKIIFTRECSKRRPKLIMKTSILYFLFCFIVIDSTIAEK
jgi:hypothetical protein